MTPEEAYEEALRRIEVAAAKKATVLDLFDLPLTKLPSEIGLCVSLKTFNLGYSSPSHVKARITHLPETISKLTALEWLCLNNIGLCILNENISKLTKLKWFFLDHNNLTSLPQGLYSLANLKELYLSDNNLVNLSEELGKLIELQRLDLSNNNLQTLPQTISLLIKLQVLDLRNNNLTNLPHTISRLTNLVRLFLANNPNLPVSPELISNPKNPQAILAYWQARKQGEARPLHEAKIILVGQGLVGKTSLVQRLLFNRFNPHEDVTKGIQIDHWNIEIKHQSINNTLEPQMIHVHLWDLGGQEILHATHQFFLTKRTLYLLVLDARQGERESRVEYWLSLINSFAGDSPVLVVINKSDQHHLDLNRRGLQQKYPNIIGFVRTSAATGEGIDQLKIKIQETLTQLPHLHTLFPQSWWTIKEQLEKLQRLQDFLPYEEYRKLCQSNEVTDEFQQNTLIGFLHDLGIALNFQDDDQVRDTNILNPKWVTQGVYALITDPRTAQTGGVLLKSQISELLDPVRYPPERQGFILRMMEKFELAYPLEGTKGYLVPDLLPVEEPIFTWNDDGALRFVYRYHILPYSILHRFMVRQHDKICAGIAWRTGVMLTYEGMKALIKADIEDGIIQISITGQGQRHEFLIMLRFAFASLHQNLTGTKPEEHVLVPGYIDITIPYNFLLELENNKVISTHWPGVVGQINVQSLLGTIETPTLRRQASLSRQELLELLSDQLNQEEARTLCFDLDIDYADLPGEGRVAKLRELVILMEKRGRIPDLLSSLNQLP